MRLVERFHGSVLDVLRELGGSARAGHVVQIVLSRANLTEEELSLKKRDGTSIVENQVHFARNDLRMWKLIDGSRHGIWTLTDVGKRTTMSPADVVMWRAELGDSQSKGKQSNTIPEEVAEPELFEGSVTPISVNRYERDPRARKACLAFWGISCIVCGLDLSKRYGSVAEGLIHVHHLTPLSSIKAKYKVDPQTDLVPICPNCHAVAHRERPPMTIEAMKKLLR